MSDVIQFRDPNNIASFVDFVKSLVDMDNYNFIDCPTAKESRGPFHKQDVVAAVLKTGGVYSEMAFLLNRRRQAVKNYIHSNRDILLFFTDIRETALDEVQKAAFGLVAKVIRQPVAELASNGGVLVPCGVCLFPALDGNGESTGTFCQPLRREFGSRRPMAVADVVNIQKAAD